MSGAGARRAAKGVAVGGSGVLGFAVAAASVLAVQAKGVRRAIGPQRSVPPYQDGRYGSRAGISLRIALLGDSLAAGLGADEAREAVGGMLAADLAQASGRAVTLTNHAVIGSRSEDLARQVTRALSAPPHLAVIIIGANDVTHWVRPSVASAHLADAVTRLQAAGAQVIVGTCPDLGTVRPVGPPLKWVARNRSRSLAAAQARAVAATGGHAIALGALLGPEFEANAEALFSPDRFHPNGEGYARIAAQVIPLARELLGLPPRAARRPARRALPAGTQ